MSDVQELLGRVADEVGPSGVTTEAVYAKAARVRWRRRAAVAAAALAVVAAGAVAVPGPASEAGTQKSSVAAPGRGVDNEAAGLIALLPKDIGAVEETNLLVVIKGATGSQAEQTYVGPLDGEYAVRRDGGIGYVLLRTMDREYIAAKMGGKPAQDFCAVHDNEPPRADCVREELPDGRVLTIWSEPNDDTEGTPLWGPELVGRLVLTDDTMLSVRDSTGFGGDRSQGPLLKTPPLSREQLRALLLSPELVAKK